mmetsp:Transcript_12431/g.16335  ORF Transcript_12431/g.16335 Transcript_12431/m.16335 type:complete len:432 (+) Transcript_12431:113-1408(+)|eukprot:CAMPEP_0198146392 /NCGR_PEP_ID=MMETSP1443-20131203/29199_1 /TAXON_ID=186043 /ORGANISM="Entomoneis sp., Strain CCMP2396" /LENGTH=431 /DNA_ID=CAMNT_0043810341 /DNA_START=42 /DNA_END=1337 /DNA_ORIENTATION=+
MIFLAVSTTALLLTGFSTSDAFHLAIVSSSPSLSSSTTTRLNAESRRDFLQSAVTTAATSIPFLLTPNPSLATAAEEGAAATVATSTSSLSLGGQIELPPLGLGAWSWGDSLFWGYNKKNDDELKQVFDYAIENSPSSVTLLDTAELYGLGRSETLIGQFSEKYQNDPNTKIEVATKFAPYPFRTKPESVLKACEASVKRLGGRPIDLYQIHFPNAYCNAEYWDGLAMAYDKGLVKAVGVSNYGVDAVRACHSALAKRGIQLATNQIQLSLLYRYPIENGLLQACEDLGVKVLSYSPLALGMLTGKYTADSPPSGPRKGVFEKLNTSPDYQNLLSTMKDVAAGHSGSSDDDIIPISQVALNWARAKNTIPIPGARTLSQVQKNYGALSWNLTPQEMKVLDQAAAKVTTFNKPTDTPFPKVDKDTGLIMYDS